MHDVCHHWLSRHNQPRFFPDATPTQISPTPRLFFSLALFNAKNKLPLISESLGCNRIMFAARTVGLEKSFVVPHVTPTLSDGAIKRRKTGGKLVGNYPAC